MGTGNAISGGVDYAIQGELLRHCMEKIENKCGESNDDNRTTRENFCKQQASNATLPKSLSENVLATTWWLQEPTTRMVGSSRILINYQGNETLTKIGQGFGNDFPCNGPFSSIPEIVPAGVPEISKPNTNTQKIQIGPADLILVGVLGTSPAWVPAVSAAMASAWAFITANAEIFALVALL